MDVRIGSIDATVVDTAPAAGAGGGDAQIERIARRVLAMIDARRRSDERAKRDRNVSSPDGTDIEDYG
jgi:hypothetical protein